MEEAHNIKWEDAEVGPLYPGTACDAPLKDFGISAQSSTLNHDEGSLSGSV